jgi:hypothetical protein
LRAIDNIGWGLTLPSSIAGVSSGRNRTVPLTVNIPDNAADGTSSGITVTATSSENTEVENSATCTARCIKIVKSVTSLTIFPSAFTLFPGYPGRTKRLTATLKDNDNSPLPSKRITWSATPGSVISSSDKTDAFGQVSAVYTPPAVVAETTQATITASFAGDDLYQASSGTSQGAPATKVTKVIGPEGGTIVVTIIETDENENLLVVPPSALSTDTTVTVSQVPPERISGYTIAGHIIIKPSGTHFSTPARLTLPYDETELPAGFSEGDLAIYCRTSGGGWERVGGTVNTTANTISVQIDHLSEYAVIANTGGVDDGGGLPLLMIGVVVAVILIVAIIAVFIIRRR